MSTAIWLEILVLVLAFLLLFMAGLVDASLVKRQRLSIRELLESGTNNGNGEQRVDQSNGFRAAVDVAMLFSVLVIGAIAAHATVQSSSPLWLLAVLPVAMLVILAIGRLIPAAMVERLSLADSSFVHGVGVVISAVMSPFLLVIQTVSALLNRPDSRTTDTIAGVADSESQSDIEDAEALERGEIQQDEHEMISGILSMEDAYAREIMVPRPDMVAVELSTPVPEVVRIVLEAGHSRIPVFEETIDRVRGIVYAKDLLRFVNDDVSNVDLTELVRPAPFVPESKPVDDLLRDLKRQRVHLAIVVDEYGGTAGLVTIEDIIEEIVGEIQDEYDREMPLYEFGTEGEITIDGRMSVDELSELMGVPMPETESDTVGGLVARELGHIPEPGEEVLAGPVNIRVESVEGRRVRTVRVSPSDDSMSFDTANPVRVS